MLPPTTRIDGVIEKLTKERNESMLEASVFKQLLNNIMDLTGADGKHINDNCVLGVKRVVEERDALMAENDMRSDWIGAMNKILGYDNSDGFHSDPDPLEIARRLVKERDRLRKALADLVGSSDKEELRGMRRVLQESIPVSLSDHAAMFNAIDILLEDEAAKRDRPHPD